jgi:predicted AlkP superfamily phosphohydrolase/phosphomutase
MTFPPKPVDGLMISGMPAPSKKVTITYPEDLLTEIEANVGEYHLYPDPGQAYSDAGVDAFLHRLYRTTETRLKVLDYLRNREDWDFFMVVFNGTDTVQHAMWKYMSPNHPLHDPKKFKKYGDAILHYFQYVDRALGEIVEQLDDHTVLMLMSDHGFGPFHKFIHVNNWLREQGWLQIKPNPRSWVKSALFDLGLAPMNVYNLLMQFGFGKLKREVVRGKGQGLLKALFLSFEDVDWSRTQAYSLGNVGQIRLNVRGREPQGIIEPGEQYESVRNKIIARLWELGDPETGEKVVQEVYRQEEVYQGENIAQAADIVFTPTRMEYFGFGEYEFGSNHIIERMKRGISGTHRPNGIFLMWGRPVKANTWLEGARIYDLAPTILHLMGNPVLPDMDGRVLLEALLPEYATVDNVLAESDRALQQYIAGSSSPDGELSEEEENMISNRLRDLGYVG